MRIKVLFLLLFILVVGNAGVQLCSAFGVSSWMFTIPMAVGVIAAIVFFIEEGIKALLDGFRDERSPFADLPPGWDEDLLGAVVFKDVEGVHPGFCTEITYSRFGKKEELIIHWRAPYRPIRPAGGKECGSDERREKGG